MQLVLGFAMPVKVAPKRQMAIGWNFQFQYMEPQNASQLHSYPPIISRQSRSKRDGKNARSGHCDRAAAYAGLQAVMEKYVVFNLQVNPSILNIIGKK